MVDFVRPVSERTSTFLSARPLLRALIVAVAGTGVTTIVSTNPSYNLEAVFSGVFDLLTIFTGFVATFFVFIAARQNVFLEKIKHTATFKMMLGLLRFTLLWSVAMIFATYVLMVLNPKDIATFSPTQFAIAFWFYNLGLIGFNFWRCIVQFNTVVMAGRE
jgi:hypothetical protein